MHAGSEEVGHVPFLAGIPHKEANLSGVLSEAEIAGDRGLKS